MISQQANHALTDALRDSCCRMEIRTDKDGRIEVRLPGNKFDEPDGLGDNLAEALEEAARHVKVTASMFFNPTRGG